MTDSDVITPFDDYAVWLAEYREAKINAELWARRADEHRQYLIALLADANVGTVDGRPAIRRTYSAGRKKFDGDGLREKYPDIYQQFLGKSEPFYTLRLLGDFSLDTHTSTS